MRSGAHHAMMVGSSEYLRPLMLLTRLAMKLMCCLYRSLTAELVKKSWCLDAPPILTNESTPPVGYQLSASTQMTLRPRLCASSMTKSMPLSTFSS